MACQQPHRPCTVTVEYIRQWSARSSVGAPWSKSCLRLLGPARFDTAIHPLVNLALDPCGRPTAQLHRCRKFSVLYRFINAGSRLTANSEHLLEPNKPHLLKDCRRGLAYLVRFHIFLPKFRFKKTEHVRHFWLTPFASASIWSSSLISVFHPYSEYFCNGFILCLRHFGSFAEVWVVPRSRSLVISVAKAVDRRHSGFKFSR